MNKKSPFDYSDMMKLFDPEQVAKLFDPKTFMQQFPVKLPEGLDPQTAFQKNQKHFDAMVEANKAAAGAYQDLMAKQMEIYGQMTSEAQERMQELMSAQGPDAVENQSEIYGKAVERALQLMAELADATRKANEEAYTAIRSQLESALSDLKGK